jgi:squalene-hopene/tetraprenyl-beta-curcumene cyclase
VDRHSGDYFTRIGIFAAIMLMILSTNRCNSLLSQEASPALNAAVPQRNSPAEPLAPVASLTRAATFLDGVAVNWTRQRHCGTCHTNYPYLMARPVLNEPNPPAMAEVRRFFEDRVAHWDDDDSAAKPRWDAEVVATAMALAFNDAATTGTLQPASRKALDRVWTLQKPDGGFNWLKCDWPPFEHDDYYGALAAALGAGHAPGGYAQTVTAKTGLARLRAYFAKNPPPDLHHRTVLLWASTRIENLMSEPERNATIDELRGLERSGGGWSLPSLGRWKRRDGSPNDAKAPSDGYATGLVVFVLRQAGVPASDAAIARGVAWLRAHQRASGRWFTRSLNNDKDHYITHAGTAYAMLALHACSATDQKSTQRALSPAGRIQLSSASR